MQSSEELFSRKLKALNGSMGHPVGNAQGKLEGGGKTNGTPAMPKMGVRARVTDWPPKKEGWGPNYETAITAFQNGQPDQNVEITDLSEAPLDPDYSDAKYSLSDLLSRSPLKGLHPIRQRSNSDVTISDIDAEDIMDQNAVNPNTGASLHREYGSTSSIDRQGLGNDGFFTMLRGYRIDSLDHRSAPPVGFPELLRYDTSLSPSLQTAAQIARGEIVRISGYDYVDSSLLYSREREKSFMRRLKSESSETSLFRKLRTIKSESDGLRLSTEQDDRRPLSFQKCFAHYDVQSVLFNISEAVANRLSLSQRKNTTTGASAASQYQVPGGGQVTANTSGPASMFESPLGSREDLNPKENLDADEGDGKSNGLVLSCPHFRNEVGGEGERRISLSRANNTTYSAGGENCSFESSLSSHCTNAGVSVLEVPRESQPIHREKVKRYIIEHIDLGAYYYHKYFYAREHQNYFGVDENLGPVAISVRREKLDDGKDKEAAQYNYRITFRTSQLTTLRGAILEDAVPSTARHGTARGLPLKEVLEYVVPELNIQCLRLAISSPKVPEQLLKLDEQGTLTADSTGTHSLYTTYKDYELMFHVSTLLPYTPNNRQQLLRKRHIGNDIVTIVFQEPGALPFTPKNIRSHFQHVFVIVKVHNPCTENVCYSVAVSRSKDVPPFGPPIPKGVTFPKSAVFRDFLLAKVINGENAAHKSEKFRAMATRTRQEYLKDLAENFVSTTTVDSAVKFSFITLGAKKKERVKPRKDAHLHSVGAVTWSVVARDFGQSADVECLLGISNEFIVLIEEESKNVIFNCSCRDVIGWSSGVMSIKIFYERGECVMFSAHDNCGEDIREIVQRLELVTRGCETTEMTLRRNGLGQLGFHVNFEGIVADVEPFGYAWKAGLRQGSRLVEICKVAVATLTHEQMIDLLRTSISVKVVIIQPYEDGAPRSVKLWMCEWHLQSVFSPESALSLSASPRLPACPGLQPSARGAQETDNCGRHGRTMVQTQGNDKNDFNQPNEDDLALAQGPGSLEDDWLLGELRICFNGNQQRISFSKHTSHTPPKTAKFESEKLHEGDFSSRLPKQADRSCKGHQHREGFPKTEAIPGSIRQLPVERGAAWDGGLSVLEDLLARHAIGTLRGGSAGKRLAAGGHAVPSGVSLEGRLVLAGRSFTVQLILHHGDAQGGDKNSSHSSSNTLSSNASSSNSDEKHFGSGDLMDPEMLGLTYIKGASTDSGIDTAPCSMTPGVAGASTARVMLQGRGASDPGHPWTPELTEEGSTEEDHGRLYLPQSYAAALAAGHAPADGSMGDLSEISSHSSGSHHSGSPLPHSFKHTPSPEPSRTHAVPQSSQEPGPSTDAHTHSWRRRSDDKAIPDEPPIQSECGGAESLLSFLLKALAERSRQLYAAETSCRLQDRGRDKLKDGGLQPNMSKEEYMKMMQPESPPGESGHRKASAAGSLSPRRSLYRTLSDESVCSNRKGSSYASSRSSMLDQAMPNDILFSSTPPYHSTLPPRISLSQPTSNLKNEFWFSDGSLADRSKFSDPGLMPLPDTATGLDWSHLVDAARAFEDQRVASFCTMTDMQRAEALQISRELTRRVAAAEGAALEAGDTSPATLTGKVNQLEVILRQLQYDLKKEKEDKAILQVEVQHLRQDNMRLQEESQTAAAQLRKFTEWFFHTIDKKP
ncbi:signal-induced proliferation-associated 1-like protein 2 [Garra rufa]|uniref:signal-induced proliferation-associated 1-like protein 2 n=1 Tax=Garra rufa TaxID=137080 RepID=UPI003CCE9CCD